MFEYAAGYAIAKENNMDLCIYRFELETIHRGSRYDLDALCIAKNVKQYTGIPLAMYLVTLKEIVRRMSARVLNLKIREGGEGMNRQY